MAIRDYQFVVGPETSTLPTATSPSASDDIATKGYVDTELSGHTGDSAAAHAASAISVTPTGNLAADDVQEGLEEIQTDLDGRFHTSTGHDHDGTDAKKVLGTNIDSTGGSADTYLRADGSGGVTWSSVAGSSFIGCRYYASASTTNANLNNNSYNIIDYDTQVYDTTSSAVTTGGSWKYTAQGNEYVKVTAGYSLNLSANLVSGNNVYFVIYKNGSLLQHLEKYKIWGTTGSGWNLSVGTGPIALSTNDYIDIRIQPETAESITVSLATGATAGCFIAIQKVGDQ